MDGATVVDGSTATHVVFADASMVDDDDGIRDEEDEDDDGDDGEDGASSDGDEKMLIIPGDVDGSAVGNDSQI